jgi:type I restriction enzyme S subunit
VSVKENNRRAAGSKMTELGPLPEEWEVKKLGDLFDVKQGAAMSKKRRRKLAPITFLRTSNILWGRVDLANLDEMDFSGDEVSKLALKLDDLLVCEGGDIGRTAIWREEMDLCLYQNHIHRLRVSDGNAYPGFFMYWMQAALTLFRLYIGYGNVTTIPNLSATRLKSFPVPLPPLPEQKAIAHVLGAIQRAREATEGVIAAARELKKSLMRHLFTYGPVPVSEAENIALEETELGTVPKEWESVKVADIVDMKYGYRTSIPKTPPPEGIEIISTADITNEGYLDISGIRTVEIPSHLIERYTVRKGDLLFNWRNAQKHVGKTAIVEFDPPRPMVFASFIIRLRALESINNRYFLYLLNHLRNIGTFFVLSRRAVNQANFNANELGALGIRLPPLPEQRKIAAVLLSIARKIETEEARWTALDELFKSLLKKLMTGEVRVDPEAFNSEEVN